MFPDWMISLTKLKKIYIRSELLKFLPSLGKLPFLESSHIEDLKDLEKVGVEFLGIESKKKKDNKIIVFPNLKDLFLESLPLWEEWIEIGEEEEEEDNYITIMPRLQYLNIIFCPKLKSLPDFLHTTPLKDLVIYRNRILQECCKWGTGEDWPKIFHIPNIKIDYKNVQKDGQVVDKFRGNFFCFFIFSFGLFFYGSC